MVQVDKTKTIGGNLDLGGADSGSTQPYMSPTDRHFAAGGSIFTAPGARQLASTQPPKGESGGSSLGDIKDATSAADGATGTAKGSIAASEASIGQITPVPDLVQGQVRAGEVRIDKSTDDAVKYGDISKEQGEEIDDLTADRDDAAADAEDAAEDDASGAGSTGTPATPTAIPPAGASVAAPIAITPEGGSAGTPTTSTEGNPFAMFNISQIGADSTPPQQQDNGEPTGIIVGPKTFATSRPTPGVGEDGTQSGGTTAPATEPVVTTVPPSSQTAPAGTTPAAGSDSSSTGNTEAQDKVTDLDGKIEEKTVEKEQTDQQTGSAVDSVKAEYKTRAAGIKGKLAAMDGKIADAAKYEKAAQATTMAGQASTTAGGVATTIGTSKIAAGTPMLSSPATATEGAALVATGGIFTTAGMAATASGAAATITGAGLKMHADSEKNSATAAKSKIAAEGQQLTKFYSRQLGKAMQADRAAGKSA